MNGDSFRIKPKKWYQPTYLIPELSVRENRMGERCNEFGEELAFKRLRARIYYERFIEALQ